MSKTRLVSSFAAALSILAAACWLAGYTFPLSAAPQAVSDASDGNVIHVLAPPARQPFEQNTVTLQARVDSGGNVIDAQVLAGPDQLRKLALQNVLNSHRPTSAAEHTGQRVRRNTPSSSASFLNPKRAR